eukprot:PITA_21046
MTRSADDLIEEIKQQLSQKFEMKDHGEMYYYLGLEVWRDSSQTFLSQGKYAKSLLTKFKMDECKVAFVPLQQNNKLQVDDGSKYADATLYRQLVGYTNSNWAGNLDDRRSITGYAFSIGSRVISWCNKKQHTVALSSVEVEYQAMCAATCQAVWLRKILQDAGEEQTEATVIIYDNKSSIKLTYNPVFHKNTKHIDTQFHFVREKVQSKEICVEYYNSFDNMADIFTKPLGRLKFELFRDTLGVFNNPFSIKGEC